MFTAHYTIPFPPAAGGHVLPPDSSHLPSRWPPPWQESHTTGRECVTLCAVLFAPSVCRGGAGGFNKRGQRCVNSKQRHILLYSTTYCTFSRSALRLCPLSEPSFGRQVFKERFLRVLLVWKRRPVRFNLSPCIVVPLCHLALWSVPCVNPALLSLWSGTTIIKKKIKKRNLTHVVIECVNPSSPSNGHYSHHFNE